MLIIINILLSLFALDSFAGHDFYSSLSTYHAPFVIQEYGRYPRADVFTKIDFDGDFNAANNWRHLSVVDDSKPYVYFSVQETEHHFYLNYGFFYPRDYAPICFWEICHENDFEGIRLTVKKDETPMGKVILMESFAHGKIKYDEDLALHPVKNQVMIFIERGGHAIRSFKNRTLPRHYKEYSSNEYELLPLEDLWKLRDQVGPESLYKDTYDYVGTRFSVPLVPAAFEGRKWGHGLSNPPWAWSGGGKDVIKGDWFFDPVTSICTGFKCLDEAGSPYIYNPFVTQ